MPEADTQLHIFNAIYLLHVKRWNITLYYLQNHMYLIIPSFNLDLFAVELSSNWETVIDNILRHEIH